MAGQNFNAQRKEEYEESGVRRNLYLVDYEKTRNARSGGARGNTYRGMNTGRSQQARREADPENRSAAACGHVPVSAGGVREGAARRPVQGQMAAGRRPVRREEMGGRPAQSNPGRLDESLAMRCSERGRRHAGGEYSAVQGQMPANRRPISRQPMSRRAAEQRRKRVLLQRATILLWVLCIAALGVTFVLRNNSVAAAGSEDAPASAIQKENAGAASNSGIMVQGLPAEVFAKHPDWNEDFLTPNEYSRPGEPLESITNIFVHYTANPGTSAAQNRSYFEQQKDTHEASVSSHFIIGYEGEIIQCVPLDEIAHAVMTRNYDSISIECCYLAEDGSFTPETYDSLISLLAWLVDAYDLQSSDILRHYDCGGKKCPLYYTDHEDKWEQLKKDVDKL